MNDHNMRYNSQKEDLMMPEYGRNVQMLVNYAKEIEEDDYRQAFIEKIVDLMQQMHPQNRNVEDYRERLWKHVFRIADFDIDVVPPVGITPTREEVFKRPDKVAYPKSKTRYRHYGNNVQSLINKAIEMEEGPKKDGFMEVIASYMKLAYRTWNRDHFVSDEAVREDLSNLSNGKLILKENASLDRLGSSHSSRDNNSRNDRNDRNHRGRGRDNNYRRNNDRDRRGRNNDRRGRRK